MKSMTPDGEENDTYKNDLTISHAFWNITDFGAKCEKCEMINTITLEKGEPKKQV